MALEASEMTNKRRHQVRPLLSSSDESRTELATRLFSKDLYQNHLQEFYQTLTPYFSMTHFIFSKRAALFIMAVFLLSASAQSQVLFDIDLTRGPASVDQPRVTTLGGEWDEGWRVTEHKQRIILDAGKTLENGLLEVWFTMNKIPINADSTPAQWLSMHEKDGDLGPEYAQLRSGKVSYGFAKIRAKSNEEGYTVKHKKINNKRCELKGGELTDWSTDDQTLMHAIIRWQDGVVSFTTPDGTEHACTEYWQYEPPLHHQFPALRLPRQR
jgi:hypothetical protein